MENMDRNCNCMNSSNNSINSMNNTNNIFNMNNMPNSASALNTNAGLNFNNNCDSTREEMMEKIKCLNFAITELGLYLDTHPEDEKALCLHRKYCKEYRDITDKYQKVYGPLSIKFPCNKWRWLEEPWPWEGGDF